MNKHLIRSAGLAVVMLLAAVAAWNPATAGERYAKQKVVYHVNYTGGAESKAYLAAMRNIRNHIKAVGAENLDVKVVLHGDGVYLLRDAADNLRLQSSVAGLKAQNVNFHVCNNTLVGRDIDPVGDLYEVFDEDIVPSGVAELSHLQAQGYTYIKP